MAPDLLEVVQSGLARRKAEWQEIANHLGYSYEFISRLGLRSYKSSPTIGRLRDIAAHLERLDKKSRTNGKQKAAA